MKSHDSNELLFYARNSPIVLIRKRCNAVIFLLNGKNQSNVAEELGASRRSIKKWFGVYLTQGIAGLLEIDPGGRPPIVPEEKEDFVKEVILKSQSAQSPATGLDIKKELAGLNFLLSLSSVYNLLHRLNLSYQTPRPVHPKRDEIAVKEWLDKFPIVVNNVTQSHPNKTVEIFFGDETRFGQQGILVRQWSEVGKRPRRERQIEYKNAWIFGAVNPQTGAHHGIVTSHAATDFMQEFIDSFSSSLHPGSHAVLVVDNAAWHHSSYLSIPSNITLHFLPPYSPELNPSECLWKFIKSKFLCNRFYRDVEDIIETGVGAWKKISTEIVKSVCACNFLPTCVITGF